MAGRAVRIQLPRMRGKHEINIFSLLNPWTLATLVTSLGLLSTLIVPDFYRDVLREEDLMYAYLPLWGYVVGCLSAFIGLGTIAQKLFSRVLSVRKVSRASARRDWQAAVVLLVVAIIANLASVIILNSTLGIGNLIGQALNGNAASARLDVSDSIASGKFGWLPAFSVPVILWSYWVLLSQKGVLRRQWLLWATCIVVYLISSILSLTRGPIFDLILNLFLIYFANRYRDARFRIGRILRFGIVAALLLGVFFLGVNQLRVGNNQSRQQGNAAAESLLGYSAASYNRLAAVMQGRLVYPNTRSGFYTTQGFWDTPVISSSIYQFGREQGVMLPEDARSNWLAQFAQVRLAGLRPDYIWSTAFGFAFSDWGYGGIVYFGIIGFVTGAIYVSFRRRRVLGIVMYPYLFGSILGLGTALTFAQRNFTIFLFTGVMITLLRLIPPIRLRERSDQVFAASNDF